MQFRSMDQTHMVVYSLGEHRLKQTQMQRHGMARQFLWGCDFMSIYVVAFKPMSHTSLKTILHWSTRFRFRSVLNKMQIKINLPRRNGKPATKGTTHPNTLDSCFESLLAQVCRHCHSGSLQRSTCGAAKFSL